MAWGDRNIGELMCISDITWTLFYMAELPVIREFLKILILTKAALHPMSITAGYVRNHTNSGLNVCD